MALAITGCAKDSQADDEGSLTWRLRNEHQSRSCAPHIGCNFIPCLRGL